MAYFSYILTVLFIVLLAYITTRYLTLIYQRGMRNRHIKVIEKVNLAADKHLWLIEFGGKYYFMSSDRKGMTAIDQRDSLPDQIINESSKPLIPRLSPFEILLQKRKGIDEHEPKA